MNYLLSSLIDLWLPEDPCYSDYNAAVGVIECCKLEFYQAARQKICRTGSVREKPATMYGHARSDMRSFIDRPRVYVAAAFTSDPVGNTRKAILVAEELASYGVITPYVPHLNLLWDFVEPHTSQFWYDYDLAWLQASHSLYRDPGFSPGADDEEGIR